jgi:parallel beta-helix repeat protein
MDKKRFLLGRMLVVGITLLLFCMSINSTIAIDSVKKSYAPINSRGILYVGGSGTNNYTYIQDAINDASEGDTVFVYDDSSPYFENVIVNKSINLIGENRDSTVIDADSTADAVYITVDWVNISGFTLTNSGSNQYDCGIDLQANHTSIIDNKIISNKYYSMCLRGSSYNNIIGNFISENYAGFDIRYNSDYNIISGNNLNQDLIIVDYRSENNTISENLCYSSGIAVSQSDRNKVLNNTIYNSYISARGDYNIIAGNTIYPNEEWYGIYLHDCKYSLVYDNVIMDGVECWGIRCTDDNYYNIITNNDIINNQIGIHIDYWTGNNIIAYNNLISNSEYGIKIIDPNRPSENHTIYHNNFIDNTWNGYDICDNYWYNVSLNEGNYWDDYDGNDSNGDGIGDTAYSIHGGTEKDFYPLMHPWGEQRPVANYTYFEEYGGYVFNASSSYDRDGEVVSFEWDFGDGETGNGMVVSHSYNSSGPYDVTLIITDDDGYKGNLTKTIDANKNYPPEIPSIDGPISGKWGKPHYFTFQTTDIEGSCVWYFVDWGDGSDTGWMGPFVSGDEVSEPHTWIEQETYVVRCKAKDMYGIQSDWAEHEITIPRTRASSYLWFLERFPILERLLSLLL